MPFPSPGALYCSDECHPRPRDVSRRHQQKRLAKLQAYKTSRGCDLCGYNKCGAALDFHHRDPKEKEHRVWVPSSEEAEKCDLLCSNCHHEVHEQQKAEENGDVYP